MKRPFEVTFIGGLFIVVGLGSTVFHLSTGPIDRWTILIVAVGAAAVVGGIFLLLGRNWARWLVLVWLAAHVLISAFESVSDALAHAVLLAVIGYLLWWSATGKYFEWARRV